MKLVPLLFKFVNKRCYNKPHRRRDDGQVSGFDRLHKNDRGGGKNVAISDAQLFRILKDHYAQGLTQREIAKQEGLSTATISRAIREGIERGYVTITLNLPTNSVPDLESRIKQKFGLSRVCVVKAGVDDPEMILQDVAASFADYMDILIKPGDSIGLSWGRTLAALASSLHPKTVENVSFVSMNGGVSSSISNTSVEQVVRAFARAYDAEAYWLPLPSYVSNGQLADALMKEEYIEAFFRQVASTNIAIFSVGGLITTSLLFNSGYFTEDGYRELIKKGYVGDICSRFFKADGSHKDDELYNRSIGITLEELKQKKKKICIVADVNKAKALLGALHGGYIDELFVDEKTATEVLRLEEQ